MREDKENAGTPDLVGRLRSSDWAGMGTRKLVDALILDLARDDSQLQLTATLEFTRQLEIMNQSQAKRIRIPLVVTPSERFAIIASLQRDVVPNIESLFGFSLDSAIEDWKGIHERTE